MTETRTLDIAGLTGLDAGDEGAERVVIALHGFPESSHMWRPVAAQLAPRGYRVIAPDMFCLGRSSDRGPATFERNRDALGELVDALDAPRVDLVLHDWGGFIGLAWACEHPDRISSLVLSDTGFFSDAKWHAMAETIRAPGGESLLEGLGKDAFAAILRDDEPNFTDETIDAYWHPFEHGRGREATVEFYRSMDFEKLAPYEPKLRELDVPALILWGADDPFAPQSGARRFAKIFPRSELVLLEGVGHFAYDSAPEETAAHVARFLHAVGADG